MQGILLIFLGLLALVIVAVIWGDILASLREEHKKLEKDNDSTSRK